MSTTDRVSLQGFLAALIASEFQLRRDECGDYRILGTSGYVYADGAGYLLGVKSHSELAWTWAKKRLVFCRLTQDGDDEGCFHLDRLPTADEAVEIRALLGIRKRPEYSEATLAAKRERFSHVRGTAGPPIRFDEEAATTLAPLSHDAKNSPKLGVVDHDHDDSDA